MTRITSLLKASILGILVFFCGAFGHVNYELSSVGGILPRCCCTKYSMHGYRVVSAEVFQDVVRYGPRDTDQLKASS